MKRAVETGNPYAGLRDKFIKHFFNKTVHEFLQLYNLDTFRLMELV
jgi:hypothetical protein